MLSIFCNATMLYRLAIVGILFFCVAIDKVSGETERREKVSVQPICEGHTYGIEIGNYAPTSATMCFAYCLDTSSCIAFTFDESSNQCSLNSRVQRNIPTCDLNMLYGQRKEYQCETNGNHRICGLDIYETPGQVSGFIFVKLLTGQWGTVCDDLWTSPTDTKGRVFCKALGRSDSHYISPIESRTDYYLHENDPINLEDVACIGLESSLLFCAHVLALNCHHFEDLHLTCFF